MNTERCPDCDLPLATQQDFDTTPGGAGEHLCWRKMTGDTCEHDPVDWRARCLKLEAKLRWLADCAHKWQPDIDNEE